MKRKLTWLGTGAFLVLLIACGGEQAPTTAGTPSNPTVQPTAGEAEPSQRTAIGARAPSASATPAPPAASTPTARPTAAVRVRLQSTAVQATPTTEAATILPGPMPAESAEGNPEEDVAEIRRIIEAYWQAFNDYDADLALSMLEEGYRSLEDELIRRDIGRMKLFRVKLEVTEESPPTQNASGEYETLIGMKTPVDSRQVRMVFRRIEGKWWIVYSNPAGE